jgi:hypothetical protein
VSKRVAVIGCGILRDEIEALRGELALDVDLKLLGAGLHEDPLRLGVAFDAALARASRPCVVIGYGACSPRLERRLDEPGIVRLSGDNCLAQLLGEARYRDELSAGAYFLLPRWARDWPEVRARAFGPRLSVLREILHVDRRYLLAIETPCGRDFRDDAERVARDVALPLRWTSVSLAPLGRALGAAVERARGAA